MKGFKELEKQRECELETEVNEYWSKIDILNQTIDAREGRKDFVFYDGPATANPMPLIRYIKSIYSNFLLNQGITG